MSKVNFFLKRASQDRKILTFMYIFTISLWSQPHSWSMLFLPAAILLHACLKICFFEVCLICLAVFFCYMLFCWLLLCWLLFCWMLFCWMLFWWILYCTDFLQALFFCRQVLKWYIHYSCWYCGLVQIKFKWELMIIMVMYSNNWISTHISS